MSLISIIKVVVPVVLRRIQYFRGDALAIVDVYHQRNYQLSQAHLQEDEIERWVVSGLVSAQLTSQKLLTLPELAWLRFLKVAETKEVSLSHLRALQTCPKFIDHISSLLVKTGLLLPIIKMILSKEEFEEFEQDFNDTSVLTDILKEELAGFSLFNALVCVAAGFKQSISLIIDANGKFAAFCPHFMEEASLPTAELTQVLTGSHTGFSINELIDISGATPPEITALSSNESRLLELIRSDRKISDIAIRMNKDGKMSLLKFTRKQVLKDMSEFERLVKKSEYCDIQFSTAQGKVLSCVKTTKIKFN